MIIYRLVGPAALVLLWEGSSLAASPLSDPPPARQEAEQLAQLPPLPPRANLDDHTGRKQKGHASYYARHFANRKMADGNRFNPNSDVAASTTLPLGTTARVTNLSNGRTATVKVEDRGPYRPGRVIDVAPKVADQLDMKEAGVVPVTVAPIAIPQPNGAVKLGAGAAEISPEEVAAATETTKAATTPARSATGYLRR
jgi:rare lipoprotein A